MHVQQNEYSDTEMARLYEAKPNEWLLMEILKTNKHGRPLRLKLLKSAKNKDELYDYLMDEVEDWSWDKNYIFVFSDPEKQCELF